MYRCIPYVDVYIHTYMHTYTITHTYIHAYIYTYFGGDILCSGFFVRVQTFCVATLTPRGDPLSASLRALVGEGWEGYDPQRASNSNSSSPKRLPGAEGPPEGCSRGPSPCGARTII